MQNQSTENSVRRQLLALAQMDKEELISKWQDLFGTTPPEYGTLFMRKRLAHRIQGLFYGGLPDMLKTQMLSQKRLLPSATLLWNPKQLLKRPVLLMML